MVPQVPTCLTAPDARRLQLGEKMVSKNTICLWYDGKALDAGRFYAETFPDIVVLAVRHAPGDYPSGKQATWRRWISR